MALPFISTIFNIIIYQPLCKDNLAILLYYRPKIYPFMHAASLLAKIYFIKVKNIHIKKFS
ncbi:hypothetical protein MGA3_12675 [Bacillus methanolicus MGA3]|nr:hypothetical protein MGA3_12675 [Bacillus methanolicus MGA3]UQD50849.1 hypothetical protein C0971_01370 [Bacillus methanolicus]